MRPPKGSQCHEDNGLDVILRQDSIRYVYMFVISVCHLYTSRSRIPNCELTLQSGFSNQYRLLLAWRDHCNLVKSENTSPESYLDDVYVNDDIQESPLRTPG